MRTKAIFDDIQSYSVLDFPSTKPPLNSKRRTRESEICNASAILEVSGKLNLLMNLNRVPLIVLGFFNFHFPIDFIGGQYGGQYGVSVLSKPFPARLVVSAGRIVRKTT